MSATGGVSQLPAEFVDVLTALRAAVRRSALRLEEIPAPSRLAPFAVALGADVMDHPSTGPISPQRLFTPAPEPEELATGRFILLYDPQGSSVWNGRFRIVTYIRAQLESSMGEDALLGSVAWTWLCEALENHGARHHSTAGTATRIHSESFGTLADRPDTVDVELRASWTPEVAGIRRHLEAWSDLVRVFAGLPPLPEGVAHLPHRRP